MGGRHVNRPNPTASRPSPSFANQVCAPHSGQKARGRRGSPAPARAWGCAGPRRRGLVRGLLRIIKHGLTAAGGIGALACALRHPRRGGPGAQFAQRRQGRAHLAASDQGDQGPPPTGPPSPTLPDRCRPAPRTPCAAPARYLCPRRGRRPPSTPPAPFVAMAVPESELRNDLRLDMKRARLESLRALQRHPTFTPGDRDDGARSARPFSADGMPASRSLARRIRGPVGGAVPAHAARAAALPCPRPSAALAVARLPPPPATPARRRMNASCPFPTHAFPPAPRCAHRRWAAWSLRWRAACWPPCRMLAPCWS